MTGNNDLLLKIIQECIQAGRFKFTDHALTKHPVREGFRARHALGAIMNGSIIEHYSDRDKCLICGECPEIEVSKEYISTYIHCVCTYDETDKVVVVTMYRPHSDEWLNQFTRKRKT